MNDRLKFLEQYDAVHDGAGLIDLSANGRIRVGGSEAVMFLNGLISNDMKTLAANHWMRAVFPTVQGRLIAVTRVIRIADEETPKGASPVFILETEEATRQVLLKTIERFTMAGDFKVLDLTDQTAMLSLQGPKAIEVLQRVSESEFSEPTPNTVTQLEWQGKTFNAFRSTHTGEAGFDLILDKEHAESFKAALLEAGAVSIGEEAMDVLRIEAGIPRYGRDMDETNVVPELELEDAISYTKGCYVGQEIIIRIKHRGHPAKKLSRLVIDGDHAITAGSAIKSLEGSDIGRVTSAAYSPRQQTTVALGFVRYEQATANNKIQIESEGINLPAQVSG